MNIYPTDPNAYLNIISIFFRLLALFIWMPGLSQRNIPGSFKILFCLVTSLALYPILQKYLPAIPTSVLGMFFLVLRETLLGALMGFFAFISFEAISFGAQQIGYQMGLGTASLLDPQHQAQVSTLVPLTYGISLVIFFIFNFHHEVIYLCVKSFEVSRNLTPEYLHSDGFLKILTHSMIELFVISIKIASPFTLISLSSQVMMGVLSRTLPQMQVMLFSFPVTVFLSLFLMYWLAPDLIYACENILSDISSQVMNFLRSI